MIKCKNASRKQTPRLTQSVCEVPEDAPEGALSPQGVSLIMIFFWGNRIFWGGYCVLGSFYKEQGVKKLI